MLEAVRALTILVTPFMPVAAERLWAQIGHPELLADQRWSESRHGKAYPTGTVLPLTVPIFPRIELRKSGEKKPAEKSQEKVCKAAKNGRAFE